MKMVVPHNALEARAIQQELRGKICIADNFPRIDHIAGVDVGYDMRRNVSGAAVVVMHRESKKVVAQVKAEMPTTFPYIPGLLSFREIPVVLKALAMLEKTPDLLMVDGQGIAHPRRMGIAAHLGVLLDIASIGVAKSRLCGKHEEPGEAKGAWVQLLDGGERIGTVLRSRERCKPLYISPGHRISHETAHKITFEWLTRYRLPEPTRLADKLSKMRKEEVFI